MRDRKRVPKSVCLLVGFLYILVSFTTIDVADIGCLGLYIYSFSSDGDILRYYKVYLSLRSGAFAAANSASSPVIIAIQRSNQQHQQ